MSETKKCEQCQTEKDIEQFYKHANKYVSGKRMGMCKDCYKANLEVTRERERQRLLKMKEMEEEGKMQHIKDVLRQKELARRTEFHQQLLDCCTGEQECCSGWVYARRLRGEYYKETERSGKWMIFPLCEDAVSVWKKIASSVENGDMGRSAKITTSRKKETCVICIYTYDSDDKADLLRLLQNIRGLKINLRAIYKEDRETRAGNYEGIANMFEGKERRVETTRSPSKWYAREGQIELLTPKNYIPFED
jgi:hypothetical protein